MAKDDLEDILSLGAVPTLRPDDQGQPGEPQSPVQIVVEGEEPKQTYDAESRTLKLEQEDGSAIFLLDQDPPKDEGPDEDDWDRNLAEELDEGERQRIVSELMQQIDADDNSRQDWLQNRAKGIEMLGFRLEEPRSDAGLSAAPLDGMSVVRHPLLPEACIRFQANAAAELYPPEGPVKVSDDTPPTPTGRFGTDGGGTTGMNNAPQTPQLYDALPGAPQETLDDLAEALETDFNHYLTVVDKEYRADSVRMLFGVGFGGCGFKKVYNCPIKRRPVSRSVDAKDLIVSNEAISLEAAGRITHRVIMRRSLMKRMQLAGAYRDVPLSQPSLEPNDVDRAISTAQGFAPTPQRPEDTPFTVDECYCELDLKGFEHKENGAATGLELPYKVSIERTSRTLLEIRRNWKQDDDTFTARRVFVKFGFVEALGFYGIGLLNILGNADRALTAAWREMLDAGMFSVFPGVLVSDAVGRQFTNELRIPPGGSKIIKTNGQPISSVVMPLPYKEPSMAMMQLIQHIEQLSQRIGGIAEVNVGEGRADAPVGTTLALIEQATKVIAAVHVGLHASQAEEFQLLKERFQDDPEAFWRHNKKPAKQWEIDQFIEALEDCHLVPAADPNMPTHLHRIMKAVAIKQLQAMNPMLYDAKAVDTRILKMMGFSDPEELFAPPQPMTAPGAPPGPPPDPSKMQALQLKGQQIQQQGQQKEKEMAQKAQESAKDEQTKAVMAQAESLDRAQDRQAQMSIASMKENTEMAKLQHQMAMRELDDKGDI